MSPRIGPLEPGATIVRVATNFLLKLPWGRGETTMERRICLRGRTDFPVLLSSGYRRLHGRGIEISPSGIIVERGLWLDDAEQPLTMRLTIRLPERGRPISALARHVRCFGSQQVLR